MSTTVRPTPIVRLVPRTGASMIEPVTYTVREVAKLLGILAG